MGRTVLARLASVLAALAVLTLSAGFTWAVADDYRERDVLPLGVRIEGADVGGMTVDQAQEEVERRVAAPLLKPVTATFESRAYTFDPRSSLSIDTVGMVREALEAKRRLPLHERARLRLTGAPLSVNVPVKLDVDSKAVGAWLSDVADDIDRPSADATLSVVSGGLKVTKERVGYELRTADARKDLVEALESGAKRVKLPVKRLKPKVAASSFKTTIIVSESKRTLRLYRGAKLEKEYRVAVGTPRYPTPKGQFKIVLKRYLPTWVNPGSGWAVGMPKTIGPGPGNPLGTRALNLDAPGIRIHGTSDNASIGTAASHGCMRMHRWDIEDLYERVQVGTIVYVIR